MALTLDKRKSLLPRLRQDIVNSSSFSIIIISTLKRKRKKKNEEIYLEQLAVTHLTCISTRIDNF